MFWGISHGWALQDLRLYCTVARSTWPTRSYPRIALKPSSLCCKVALCHERTVCCPGFVFTIPVSHSSWRESLSRTLPLSLPAMLAATASCVLQKLRRLFSTQKRASYSNRDFNMTPLQICTRQWVHFSTYLCSEKFIQCRGNWYSSEAPSLLICTIWYTSPLLFAVRNSFSAVEIDQVQRKMMRLGTLLLICTRQCTSPPLSAVRNSSSAVEIDSLGCCCRPRLGKFCTTAGSRCFSNFWFQTNEGLICSLVILTLSRKSTVRTDFQLIDQTIVTSMTEWSIAMALSCQWAASDHILKFFGCMC